MLTSVFLTSALAYGALGAIKPRNFIYIIPDGMAPASETVARVFDAFMDGETDAQSPLIEPIPIDTTPVGNVRTYSADDLVTDSAAAGTALATGFKTLNGALGVNAQNESVGTVMEAAKLAGMKTGLVVSSIMNHATPAAFSSHVLDRNAYDAVAEQQVGYSHPLNISVDLLLGGGACYFRPSSDERSCREDDVDLFAYAESVGYQTADDLAGFQAMQEGSSLPVLGLFTNDGHLAYEVDRLRQPEETREPSLSELVEYALPILSEASACESRVCKQKPGYFIMIEASRIDHASHVHDSVAHLGDVREYNKIITFVKQWIDEHPDTAMISVADHETGGMTLPREWDPTPLADFNHSVEFISDLYSEYDGDDNATYIAEELLPMYGLTGVNETQVQSLVDAGPDGFAIALADLTNLYTGIAWSTDDHTGVDVTLYAYAAGEMGQQLRKDLAGHHENTALPRYIEKALGLDIDEVTRRLRALGDDWIP